MGFGIGDFDWGWGLGIGDFDWEFGLGIGIGDWGLRFEVWDLN